MYFHIEAEHQNSRLFAVALQQKVFAARVAYGQKYTDFV
jgi:hypothetical protein